MAAILLAPSRILHRSVVAKWQRAAELNAQVCASGSRYEELAEDREGDAARAPQSA